MKTTNLKTAAVAALFGIGLFAGCTDSATNQKTSDNMKTLSRRQDLGDSAEALLEQG